MRLQEFDGICSLSNANLTPCAHSPDIEDVLVVPIKAKRGPQLITVGAVFIATRKPSFVRKGVVKKKKKKLRSAKSSPHLGHAGALASIETSPPVAHASTPGITRKLKSFRSRSRGCDDRSDVKSLPTAMSALLVDTMPHGEQRPPAPEKHSPAGGVSSRIHFPTPEFSEEESIMLRCFASILHSHYEMLDAQNVKAKAVKSHLRSKFEIVVASQLHDAWRFNRLVMSDGLLEPRIKTVRSIMVKAPGLWM